MRKSYGNLGQAREVGRCHDVTTLGSVQASFSVAEFIVDETMILEERVDL